MPVEMHIQWEASLSGHLRQPENCALVALEISDSHVESDSIGEEFMKLRMIVYDLRVRADCELGSYYVCAELSSERVHNLASPMLHT